MLRYQRHSEIYYRGSTEYANKQMKRLLRVVKWRVAESIMPSDCYVAIKCVEPLRRGRCGAREAAPVMF